MGSTTTSTRPAGGRIGRSILAASMSVAAIAASVTGAYFTDSEASTGNEFATGSVDIALDKTTAIVAQANMAPGDEQDGSVTVTNSGSLEMRYALSSVTTENVLAAQLDLTVWAEADEGASAGDTCATTPPETGALYPAGDLGSTTGTNVIGDPTGGSQTGDRVLAANASELLCFHVKLPDATGNSFESVTTTAEFTFDAEQTANNA